MKVGSIVEVLPGYMSVYNYITLTYIKWKPSLKTPYMIRAVGKCNVTGKDVVALEEGVLGKFSNGNEVAIAIEYVRELMPHIENIEEFINENVGELV